MNLRVRGVPITRPFGRRLDPLSFCATVLAGLARTHGHATTSPNRSAVYRAYHGTHVDGGDDAAYACRLPESD